MSFDYTARMRKVRECFLADDVDEAMLRECLRNFAEQDWDAGRDATHDDCSDLNPHRPAK